MKRYLLLILALLAGAAACSRQDIYEEKMRALEGNYYPNKLDSLPDVNSPYVARILKSGDQWVFSFSLPVEPGSPTFHQFEQGITWSPEVNAYLFDNLSKADCERMGADLVVTEYKKGLIRMVRKVRNDSGFMLLEERIWKRR